MGKYECLLREMMFGIVEVKVMPQTKNIFSEVTLPHLHNYAYH